MGIRIYQILIKYAFKICVVYIVYTIYKFYLKIYTVYKLYLNKSENEPEKQVYFILVQNWTCVDSCLEDEQELGEYTKFLDISV